VLRWSTPWPLIQVSDVEWLVMRDDLARPAAVIRKLDRGPRSGAYRVVRWAPRSEDRRLFEYFPTLELADMAVTFVERRPDSGFSTGGVKVSPEWERFERYFWEHAPDRLVSEYAPRWFGADQRARLARAARGL